MKAFQYWGLGGQVYRNQLQYLCGGIAKHTNMHACTHICIHMQTHVYMSKRIPAYIYTCVCNHKINATMHGCRFIRNQISNFSTSE